ncbi:MAG: hypothetical protein LBP87_13070 [Planctomycetaceae bacterium]|nr:hypothetical protein [Planctomycetaceae bacterium]
MKNFAENLRNFVKNTVKTWVKTPELKWVITGGGGGNYNKWKIRIL